MPEPELFLFAERLPNREHLRPHEEMFAPTDETEQHERCPRGGLGGYAAFIGT